MVTNGRNIVISCFETRTLVFFARASHKSSPNKRFETPFLTPKRTKCLQKFLKGPQKDPQVTHRRPKDAQITKTTKKINILLAFGVPKTLQKEPPDRQNSQQINAPKKFFLALNFHLIFGRFSPPNRLQKCTNFQPLPTTWIL